jgi:hypothetical protein
MSCCKRCTNVHRNADGSFTYINIALMCQWREKQQSPVVRDGHVAVVIPFRKIRSV